MQDERDFNRAAWGIMGGLLVIRLIVAGYATMIVDEAYAISVAREFSISFFDHPPLSFWAPVASAKVFGAETALIFRLPAVALGTLTAFIIWRLGALIGGAKAALWTLGLYVLAPAFALAGAIMVPDPAVEFGVVLTAYWLVRIVQKGDHAPFRFWLWAGLALAFALASKYQAALVPVMALVFAVSTQRGRRWFARPGPYVAALIGLVGLSPVLIWNIGHDWASFAYHTGRTGQGLNPGNFGRMAALQLVFLLPPVAVAGGFGMVRGWRGPDRLLLALLAAGPVIAFNLVYLFARHSFPHWTMPGWILSLPLAGAVLATTGARPLAWFKWSAILLGGLEYLLVAAVVIHLKTGLFTNQVDPIPQWDRYDAMDVSGLEAALQARGLLEGTDLIVTDGWIKGGFMSLGLHGHFPVLALRDPHHFAFMSGAGASGAALFLHPVILPRAGQLTRASLQLARQIDPAAELLDPVILKRGSRDYLEIVIIRLHVGSPG